MRNVINLKATKKQQNIGGKKRSIVIISKDENSTEIKTPIKHSKPQSKGCSGCSRKRNKNA